MSDKQVLREIEMLFSAASKIGLGPSEKADEREVEVRRGLDVIREINPDQAADCRQLSSERVVQDTSLRRGDGYGVLIYDLLLRYRERLFPAVVNISATRKSMNPIEIPPSITGRPLRSLGPGHSNSPSRSFPLPLPPVGTTPPVP